MNLSNYFMKSFLLALLMPSFFISSASAADYFDPTGTWTGSVAETEGASCSDPGTQQISVNVTFSVSTPGHVDYQLTFTDRDGTVSEEGTATFKSSNAFEAFDSRLNDEGFVDNTAVTFTAVSDDKMDVHVDGYETGGGSTCTWMGRGSVTRASSGDLVNPEDAPSNSVTGGVATLNQIVSTTTATLGARIQNAVRGATPGFRTLGQGVMLESISGLAAGDTFQNVGIWGSYSYTDFENDFSRTAYDGDRHMIFTGVDFMPRDNIVLGLAVGYEDTNMTTDFNNGSLDADGWTFAPYLGVIINDTWNADVSLGYSDVNTSQNRAGGTITSNVDTERWFLSANINGYTQINNWFLTGRSGLLSAKSEDGSFTESNGTAIASSSSSLTQFSIGGEAAYSMNEFEPFISATYNRDLHATETVLTAGPQPSSDDDDLLLGIGLRYFGKQNLSLTAQLDKRVGREDISEDTISLNARWDFD